MTFKLKSVDWSRLFDRPKRPHDELLTEAEAITEHTRKRKEQLQKGKHHDRKRT